MLKHVIHSYFDWPWRHREELSPQDDSAFLKMREALLQLKNCPDHPEALEKVDRDLQEALEALDLKPSPKICSLKYERLEDLAKAKEDLQALSLLHLLQRERFHFARLASDSRIVYVLIFKRADLSGIVEDFEDWQAAEKGFFLHEALTPTLEKRLLPLLATPTEETTFKVSRYALHPRSPVNFRPAFQRLETFEYLDMWGKVPVYGWAIEFVNATGEAFREWVRRFVLDLALELGRKDLENLVRKKQRAVSIPEDHPYRRLFLDAEKFWDRLLLQPESISLKDWKDLQENPIYRQAWDRLRKAGLIDHTGLPLSGNLHEVWTKGRSVFEKARLCPMCGEKIITRKSQVVCSNTCRQKLKRFKDKHFLPVISELNPLATVDLATVDEVVEALRERLRKIKHPWFKPPADLRTVVEKLMREIPPSA